MMTEKNIGLSWDEKRKAIQESKLTAQFEEINQKLLVKEERYQNRIKRYRHSRIFKSCEKIRIGGMHMDKLTSEWLRNKTVLVENMGKKNILQNIRMDKEH